ncbi:MAG: flagellar FliJ family protein [Mycobacteriales bacterium]
MKRYHFRLEPVLRVRRMQEEAARGQLLAANAAIRTQEQQLTEQTAAYEKCLIPSGIQPRADFLFEQSTRSAFAAAVIEQRGRVRRAHEDATRARTAWSETASRVGALERLDERQRSEHQAQTQKEDELTTDELVVSRHGRSDR